MSWDIALIFVVLGVILPWRGRARLKKLLAMPHVGTMERLVLYASTIGFQWLAVAVVGWRAWAHGYTADQLGLTVHDKGENSGGFPWSAPRRLLSFSGSTCGAWADCLQSPWAHAGHRRTDLAAVHD